MSTPRDIIEKIRRRDGAIRLDGTPIPEAAELLVELNNAVEKLAKEIYSKKTHFIFELIQNAEDNEYRADAKPSLKFVLLSADPTKTNNSGGCLCVFNNEAGFAENNVRAISTIGKSTKTDSGASGFIGEKGIGFKSVFQITSSPHIFSNGFQFKFVEKDPVAKLGYIVPYWVEEIPEIVGIHYDYTTALLLPLKRGEFEGVKAELEKFEAETILFLNKLHRLEIRTNDSHIVIKKEMNGQLCTLTTLEDDEKVSEFWIEKNTFERPDEVEEEKRPKSHHTEREVSVAFPLSEITEQEKIFAYLPTEEFPGFPFFINGDFLLSSSRESILKENAWNDWLFEKTAQVAAEGVIAMLGDADVGSKAYRFVPLEKDISPGQEAFHPLVKSIQDNVAAVPCIRGEDEVLHLPTNSRLIPPKYRFILDDGLPSYFDGLNLAERAANEFKARLKPLGLEAIKESNLEDIFADKEWVQKKDIEWCAKVLVFLAGEAKTNLAKYKKVIFGRPKPYKMSLDKFALVPAMNGQKHTGAHLFMPLSDDHQRRLANIPNDLRNELLTIDPAIIQALTKLEADPEILTSNFEVQDFSVSNFISKTMLKTLNGEQGGVSVDHLKRSINFCMSCWDELEEDGETDILNNLPLLLENDEIVALSAEDREIVSPRTWDKKTGWQLVFDSQNDKQRLAVLNSFYSSLDRDLVTKYFQFMDITEFPDAELRSYNSTNIGKAFERYAAEVRQGYFNNYSNYNFTQYKQLQSQVPPQHLLRPFSLNESFRTAFVHWLKNVDKSENNWNPTFTRAKAEWFYRTAQKEFVESELLMALKNIPWVKTPQGFKTPGEVFIDDSTLRQWFGNELAFLEDDLDDHTIDLIGIQKKVSTNNFISLLSARSKAQSTDRPDAIYRYLNEKCEGYETTFSEQNLIYTSQNGGKWLTSKEVIWRDGSAALMDGFGWLEHDYPNLRDFFVGKLGVKESIDVDAYADRWLTLQDTNDQLTVETFLNRGFSELKLDYNTLESNKFRDECMLWSLDREWRSPEDIYIDDSAMLSSLFKDDLYFVWTPKYPPRIQLEQFFDWLNVKSISSSVTFEISDDRNAKQSEVNNYFNEHSTELIARLVSSAEKEKSGHFVALLETGKLHAILSLVEFKIERLTVSATIQDRSHEILDKAAFLDWKTNRAFISTNRDSADVRDDLAEALARHISGRQYRNIIPFLKDILTVRTKERRQKLQTNYGWGFSGDHGKQFSNLKKEFDQSSQIETPETLPHVRDASDGLPIEKPETKTPTSEINPLIAGPQQVSGQEISYTPTNSIAYQPEEHSAATVPSTVEPSVVSIANPGGATGSSKFIDASPDSNSIPVSKAAPRSKLLASSGAAPLGPRYSSVSDFHSTPRVGKSRSSGRARSHNYASRNRMLSYVSPDEPVERDSDSDTERAAARKKQGDRGENIVVEDLLAKGYLAEAMPFGNPGYDIEAIHPQTGEILFIEVKSLSGLWDGQGVTISQRQYDYARHYGESYFLAIVESLNETSQTTPVYIQDPVSKINNYAFDVNWRNIATNVSTIIPPVGAVSTVDALIAETDSKIGEAIIRYCEQYDLDLPEIGGDICDAQGRVILDNIELVWEEYSFAVYMAGGLDIVGVKKADNWVFLPDDRLEDITLKLRNFMDLNTEDNPL